MDNRPIGLLDSGIGGLSVVKKVIAKLPYENTIFIGDQAHMPYGDRSQEDVIELTRRSVDFLLKKQVKLIIFACNTATAAAMPTIQKEIDPQIIGVIQSGSLAAARTTKNKQVAVIATSVTANSHAYQKDINFRDPQIKVTELATPALAPLVEEQKDYQANLAVVKKSLAPLKNKNFDTLVLGCTHYPFIAKEILANFGGTMQIVDPADQVAQYTKNVLVRDHLLADQPKAVHRYYTTGDAAAFTETARSWMNDPQLEAEHVDTGEE
jgi:glutamate racemase